MDTARARHLVIMLIRAFAVVVVASVFVAISRQVLDQVPYGWGRFTDRPIFTLRSQLVWSAPLVVVAAVLWLLQVRIARLIVPHTDNTCPQCGYSLRTLTGSQCPECGCRVGSMATK